MGTALLTLLGNLRTLRHLRRANTNVLTTAKQDAKTVVTPADETSSSS